MDENPFFNEEHVNGDEEDGRVQNVDALDPLNGGLEDITGAQKRKRNLKPVPKLDVRRLLGPRGLPCLKQEFENTCFQGQGHEEENLDILMAHLEHWTHRMYPKMMFDDCLEKIEKLGHRKEIHTCMKKIRMGMPLLNTDQETTVITEDGPEETTVMGTSADDMEQNV